MCYARNPTQFTSSNTLSQRQSIVLWQLAKYFCRSDSHPFHPVDHLPQVLQQLRPCHSICEGEGCAILCGDLWPFDLSTIFYNYIFYFYFFYVIIFFTFVFCAESGRIQKSPALMMYRKFLQRQAICFDDAADVSTIFTLAVPLARLTGLTGLMKPMAATSVLSLRGHLSPWRQAQTARNSTACRAAKF